MYACRMINQSLACVKEIVNGFEISIAFDDSCGTSLNLSRGDIRIFVDDTDVSGLYTGDSTAIIPASIENLIDVYNWALSQ